MCTALVFRAENNYFGRNLDLERSYGEAVVVTPCNFNLKFRFLKNVKSHAAMIGMALVEENYPLYFEAVNQEGLFMASLNFPENACYFSYEEGKTNLCPFEFIPYVLSVCETVEDAKEVLKRVNLVNENFNDRLANTPLHWLIADKQKTITVESTKSGLMVYNNPIEVLTNNPPFNYHLTNLNNYLHLHEGESQNLMGAPQGINNYSLGLGALGLPGDYSSSSRFVRAAFVKQKVLKGKTDKENINQFFHILSSVAMPKGCVKLPNGEYEYTRYSCCINGEKGIYGYKLYENANPVFIDMNRQNLKGSALYVYTTR